MLSRLLIALLLCLSVPMTYGGGIVPTHEFHLSRCHINYNVAEEALQMTLHLFLDDLEDAMLREGIDKQFLCTEKEKEDAEIQLYRYLQMHFQLRVNQQAVTYEFVGKEVSDDLLGVWGYLEVKEVDQVSALTISNRLILDLHADQRNITSVLVPPGKQTYLILDRYKSQESLNYAQ